MTINDNSKKYISKKSGLDTPDFSAMIKDYVTRHIATEEVSAEDFYKAMDMLLQYKNYDYHKFVPGKLEHGLSMIDSSLDAMLLVKFQKCLAEPAANITHDCCPFRRVQFYSYELFREVMEPIWNDPSSFLYFLRNVAKSFIYNWAFVSLMQPYDKHDSKSVSKSKRKITYAIRQYLSMELADDGNDIDPPVFSAAKKNSTTTKIAGAYKKISNGDLSGDEFNRLISFDEFSRIYATQNANVDATLRFKRNYFSNFSLDRFAKSDMAFTNIYNDDTKEWLAPSFLPYTGFLLRNFGAKEDNNLFRACNRYRDHRLNENDYNEWQQFDTMTKQYQELLKKSRIILNKIQKPETVYCSTFMLQNLFHPNFFSSLSSDLFQHLSKNCNLDKLLNFDENNNNLSASEYQCLLNWDTIKILSLFDVDMKELSKCNFHANTKLVDDYTLKDVMQFNDIGDNIQIPIDAIYRFLSEILHCMPQLVSSILNDIKHYNQFLYSSRYDKRYFFNKFFEKYVTLPDYHKEVAFTALSPKQRQLVTHLIYYPTCTGIFKNKEIT